MQVKMPHRGVPCMNVGEGDTEENPARVRPIVDVLPFKRKLSDEGESVRHQQLVNDKLLDISNGESAIRERSVRSSSLLSFLAGDGGNPGKRLRR